MITNPIVKLVLTIIAVAAGAVAAYQSLTPTIRAVAGAIAAVASALLGGFAVNTSLQLKRVRAENLQLRNSATGRNP